MQLIRGQHNLHSTDSQCAVTIGAFDGVHRGHQQVLAHLKAEAAERGLETTVITFEPMPGEFLFPDRAPPRLMTFREKAKALAAEGIDRLLCLRFDHRLRSMSPRDFIQQIFVDGLGARYIAFGDDFRFGKAREGDLAYTESLASEFGYEVVPTSTFDVDGERVSSTRIREALARSVGKLARRSSNNRADPILARISRIALSILFTCAGKGALCCKGAIAALTCARNMT